MPANAGKRPSGKHSQCLSQKSLPELALNPSLGEEEMVTASEKFSDPTFDGFHMYRLYIIVGGLTGRVLCAISEAATALQPLAG